MMKSNTISGEGSGQISNLQSANAGGCDGPDLELSIALPSAVEHQFGALRWIHSVRLEGGNVAALV